jgi:hypothetical protein
MLHTSEPLTLEQIAVRAPSALAHSPHSSRSERYAYIPTIGVIEAMQKAGFFVFEAKQSSARSEDKRSFTKHMIRFRHSSQICPIAVGDALPEVVLVNSHDGSSAYRLMAGIFRLVCSNGMIVADSMQDSISVRHSGNVIDAVVEGSQRIIEQIPQTLHAVTRWSQLQLTDGEQLAFADSARTLRFGDSEGNVDTPITAEQLLRSRRAYDSGPDLWKTLNRVQENVIRGGMRAYGRDANNRRRIFSAREVKGIDQDVKLNKALWQLAERMAELKSA